MGVSRQYPWHFLSQGPWTSNVLYMVAIKEKQKVGVGDRNRDTQEIHRMGKVTIK